MRRGAAYDGFRKRRKVTWREAFPAEMDRVAPWRKNEQHLFSQFAMVNPNLARHTLAPGG
jgi:hypothetical protein